MIGLGSRLAGVEFRTQRCYQISRNTRNILPPFEIPPFTGSLPTQASQGPTQSLPQDKEGDCLFGWGFAPTAYTLKIALFALWEALGRASGGGMGG